MGIPGVLRHRPCYPTLRGPPFHQAPAKELLTDHVPQVLSTEPVSWRSIGLTLLLRSPEGGSPATFVSDCEGRVRTLLSYRRLDPVGVAQAFARPSGIAVPAARFLRCEVVRRDVPRNNQE